MNAFHFSIFQSIRSTRKWWLLGVSLVAFLLLSGCAEAGQMRYQPRLNPLSATTLFANGSSAQVFVPNTVPYSSDPLGDIAINSALDVDGKPLLGFPMPITKELVTEGQERFNIYCVPCHGDTGQADGMAVAFGFPKPPDLLSDVIIAKNNYTIFDTITNGFGLMFPYGYRVKPSERWAVIAYIRALQIKNGPVTPADLTPADLNQIGNVQ
ncbi:MAG: hypothetical protein BGO78_02480 [Chloroflexi bacterium 44-23]|nr:MAG: hypothetical protein BGO78_02480 [Chloroflexi bacterium 44-23]